MSINIKQQLADFEKYKEKLQSYPYSWPDVYSEEDKLKRIAAMKRDPAIWITHYFPQITTNKQ